MGVGERLTDQKTEDFSLTRLDPKGLSGVTCKRNLLRVGSVDIYNHTFIQSTINKNDYYHISYDT